MTRDIDSGVASELQAAVIRPVFFFEGQFDSSYLRLSTMDYDYSWNSQTWLGNGYLRLPQAISESTDLSAESMQITLSGVPGTLVSLVLGETQERLTGKLWLGLLNSSEVLLGTPIQLFSGLLDVPEINVGPEFTDIRLTYESDLIKLEIPKGGRYTDEHQKSLFATDKGFEWVIALQSWSGLWVKGKSARPSSRERRRRIG